MDYEQKYNEALKIAEKKKENSRNAELLSFIDDIFPELKDSKDEKIRKELIKWVKDFPDTTWRFISRDDVIAWLEKQGERKSDPFNGVSFEYNNHSWGMCARDNGVEILIDDKIKAFISLEKSFIYLTPLQHSGTSKVGLAIDARLWTIQDAKAGDVLVCPKYAGDIIPNIFIFKDIDRKDNDVYCYCSFLKTFTTEGYVASADPIDTDFCPATKEQYDILFKKMEEAGYEWDSEKKELKKI